MQSAVTGKCLRSPARFAPLLHLNQEKTRKKTLFVAVHRRSKRSPAHRAKTDEFHSRGTGQVALSA